MSKGDPEQRLQNAAVQIVEAIADWFMGKATLMIGQTAVKLVRDERR